MSWGLFTRRGAERVGNDCTSGRRRGVESQRNRDPLSLLFTEWRTVNITMAFFVYLESN